VDGGRQTLDRARLGSFERWSSVIGGILGIAGVPGFLANLDQLYEAADIEGQAWREFTAAWWQTFRDQPKKVSELNQFCEERELMLRLRGDGSARSNRSGWATPSVTAVIVPSMDCEWCGLIATRNTKV